MTRNKNCSQCYPILIPGFENYVCQKLFKEFQESDILENSTTAQHILDLVTSDFHMLG